MSVQAFVEELIAVMEGHGLAFEGEDPHCGLEVVPYTPDIGTYLRAVYVTPAAQAIAAAVVPDVPTVAAEPALSPEREGECERCGFKADTHGDMLHAFDSALQESLRRYGVRGPSIVEWVVLYPPSPPALGFRGYVGWKKPPPPRSPEESYGETAE